MKVVVTPTGSSDATQLHSPGLSGSALSIHHPHTLLLHANPTTCYNQHSDKRPQLLPEKRARTSHPADMDDLALCVLSEEVQGGFFLEIWGKRASGLLRPLLQQSCKLTLL